MTMNQKYYNTEYIVSGFIREVQQIIKNNTIPSEICELCVKYYRINEWWDILGRHTTTTLDDICLTKTNDGWDNTSYGRNVAPSIGNFIYKWSLKIVKTKSRAIYIGIASNITDRHLQPFVDNKLYNNYAWNGTSGLIYCKGCGIDRGDTFDEGDIVEIELNTKTGKASFNDTVFNVLQRGHIKYRLAATLHNKDDCIIIQTFGKYAVKQ